MAKPDRLTAKPAEPRPGQPRDPLELEFLPDAAALEESPLPPVARATLYLLLALVLIGIAWASWAELDRIVVARGKLITTASNIVLQPLETAVVRTLKVKPGQVVQAGEVLAELDPTFATADLTALQTRAAGLSSQIRRLRSELTGAGTFAADPTDPVEALQAHLFRERKHAFEARIALYAETLSRLEQQRASNRRDQEALEARLVGLREIEAMREKLLANETGSRLNFLGSRDQRLSLDRELVVTRNRFEEIGEESRVVMAERRSFVQEWLQRVAEELVQAEREHDAVLEQLNKAQRRSDLVALTAPAAAVVLEIAQRSVGSVVREAEPLVTLVPLDVDLEAEVEIEARDIGFVRMNDPAQVKIDAFPYQKHGLVPGSLRTVSEDAFARTNAMRALERGSEAYYRGRVTLTALALRDVGPESRLIPGMTLTAEIKVGRRTVLSYFLYPIIRSLDESMREP